MNDINDLIEELREMISSPELAIADRFQTATERIVAFLAASFGAETDEVALLWKRGHELSFLWPEFLARSKALPLDSNQPVAVRIFRSGASFLDNRFMEREHMVEYEFVKEPDGDARRIWKLMGAAITVDGERLGVVEVSRKRSAFAEPGPDFTPGDLQQLEKLLGRLGPILRAVVPF